MPAQSDNEQREWGKITLKRKTSQNEKKYRQLRSKHAEIATRPPDNFQMNESVKVSNSTVQLRNAEQRIYLNRSN